MKRILLTSTALVMVAGIAAADGHSSMTWSGKSTAGLARDGAVSAVSQSGASTTAQAAAIADVAGNTITTAALYATAVNAQGLATLNANKTAANAAATTLAGTTAAQATALRAAIVATLAELKGSSDARDTKAKTTALNAALVVHDSMFGSALAAAGDFKSYAEVNATVTGSVTAGSVTVSASVSVDAGTGYDFANDDSFDGAKTNGVGLDSVTVDMGTAGTLMLNANGVAHLVDGDDDAAGDIKYTNTFGGVAIAAVVDLDKDGVTDGNAAAASMLWDTATDLNVSTAAVAADTQWSAKATMPVGAGSVFVAMDEEKGNHFGGSTTLSGVAVSFDSKIEAEAAAAKGKRSNTLGLSYAMGSVTVGGSYNSVKDGDQWGVSASYASGDASLSVSTDEGSDWSVSAGYTLGAGASVQAGVNYTEDAFLGLSFAF